LAAIVGFYVAGPLAAAVVGVGGWLGTYFLVEPFTRPTKETGASIRRTPDPKPRKITDDDIRRTYGTPTVYWSGLSAPWVGAEAGACDYGPVSLTYPERSDITWQFYFPIFHPGTILVRVSGGDNYSPAKQQKLCDAVQMVAARKFQADALRARQRAENARKAQAEEQQRVAAAERAEQQRRADEARAERERLAAQKREEEARLNAERQARWDREAEQRRIESEAREARMARLKAPIPLVPVEAGVIFGTSKETGEDLIIPVQKIQHLLIGGMTGSGKSVFLHQLAYQLLQSTEVNRVVLVDLKGGTEFDRYSKEPKALVLWDFRDVVKLFDELVALLEARENEMRQKGLRSWPGGRVFVIIDEYAEIHDSINDNKRGELKEAAGRLASNLKSVIRRARSSGVVMICALQKPTTDAMDSTLRANMSLRACFRVKTRHSVEATLDGYDHLPVDPLTLRDGGFVFDSGRGEYVVLQAQIAPGVELGGGL